MTQGPGCVQACLSLVTRGWGTSMLMRPVPLVLLCPKMLQVKDKWDFRMTARYELYADLLQRFTQPDFKQQVIKDPSLAAAVPEAHPAT